MSVSLSSSQVVLAWNGTGTYTFPFPIQTTSDLSVVVTDSTGALATLALGTDYTVTIATLPLTGGSVVISRVVSGAAQVTISRVVPLTQGSSFSTAGRLPASTIEAALDKLTYGLQQLQRAIGKCVRQSDAALIGGSSNLAELGPPNSTTGTYYLAIVGGALSWVTQAIGSISGTVVSASISTGTYLWKFSNQIATGQILKSDGTTVVIDMTAATPTFAGNAATATTATTAGACSGNAATATTAGACSGNAATATAPQAGSTLSKTTATAWGSVTLSGATATLNSPSYGITSVSRSTTGTYVVTLSSTLSSYYVPLASGAAFSTRVSVTSGSTFTVTTYSSAAALADFSFSFVIFGN